MRISKIAVHICQCTNRCPDPVKVDVEIKVKLPYRYVIVQLEATGTILNFCEIEVYENGQFSLSFYLSNGGSVDALRPHKNVS